MNISINFRYVVLGLGLLITGCHGPVVSTVSETAGVTQTDEPVPDKADSVTEDSINESPEPAWTPEMYAHMAETALGGLVRGAVADAPYQPVMTSCSLNDALYLMRAARYEEARMRASMIRPATSASRFIMAKASILAGLCGPDNPQSGVLLELYKKTDNQDLKPIYQYWLYYAWIDENALDKAANGIDKYHDGDDIDKKYYRQLVLHFAQKVTDNESGDDYEKRLIKWLNKVESNGNGFEASSAIHFRYLLAQKAGRTKEAASLAKRLVTGYPATQMALWPQLFENCKDSLSSNERYHRALRLIKHFDYENARLELIDLVDNKRLTGKTLEDAEWELARIAMTNTDNPDLSENIYKKFASQKGARQEDAVFGIARAKSRQLDYRSAIKALEAYESRYPHGKYIMRSLYLKGWYWFDLRENEKARPYLKQYAEKTNDTSVWGFYAQTFIREGRWEEAIKAFEKLKGNRNPIVHGKALYWQAYAYHEIGEAEKSRQHLESIHESYPFTYYDILAFRRESEWYGVDYRQAIRARFRLDADKPGAACHQLLPWGTGCDDSGWVSSGVWQKILLYIEHDEVERARQLYQKNDGSILSQVPASKRAEFKRYATHLVEDYHRAWSDSSGSIRAYSTKYPERTSAEQQMAYPQAFAPLVESLSRIYRVPRFFIYGIMLQESRFRPWQVSSADAIGALQMIPKTATKVASELGLEYHPETFFEPKIGFPYSVFYMKKHLDMWHQNLTFTAGSYNGGPHRIGPWMMRDKDKTMDFIVEEFSFDESRHYARKVAEHTLRYLYMYSESASEQMRVLDMLFPERIIADEPESGWGY